ncbi:MAG: hypothetical protein J6V54_04375 [Bacteroidales bacterium]|nr:hypothetical protein [Bacteroidales bacterium]
MDDLFGWLVVVFLALALIIILLTQIKGWRFYKNYNEGSGILAYLSLFTIVYDDMRKLAKKNELPAHELEAYHAVKRGCSIAICCIAVDFWFGLLLPYGRFSDVVSYKRLLGRCSFFT